MKALLKSCIGSFVLPMLCVGVLAVGAFYFAEQLDQKEQRVISANDGYGSASNPLPMNRDIRFEPLTLRIADYIDPANHRIGEISGLSASANTKYVMVWLEGECQQEMCYGYQVLMSAIDATGEKYRALTIGLIDDFAADSARYHRDIKGWVAFEIPYNSDLQLLEIIYDQVALYVTLAG